MLIWLADIKEHGWPKYILPPCQKDGGGGAKLVVAMIHYSSKIPSKEHYFLTTNQSTQSHQVSFQPSLFYGDFQDLFTCAALQCVDYGSLSFFHLSCHMSVVGKFEFEIIDQCFALGKGII